METKNVCAVIYKTCMAVKYSVKMHTPLKTSGNTANIVVSMQKPCFCISYLTVETEKMIWPLKAGEDAGLSEWRADKGSACVRISFRLIMDSVNTAAFSGLHLSN